MQRTLLALRRLGVRFAIDDYGDGWADMTSVEIVKPEIIKVRLDRLRAGRTGAELADALRDASDAAPRPRGGGAGRDLLATCTTVRAFGFSHAQGWYWTADPDCRR